MEFWAYIGYFISLIGGIILGGALMFWLILRNERTESNERRKKKRATIEDSSIAENEKTVVLKNSISLKERLQPKKASLAETQCEIEGRDLAETLKATRRKEDNTFKGLKKEIEKKRYKLN